jgi:hypothetical protein
MKQEYVWSFTWIYETININQQYQPDGSDVVFINNGTSSVNINGLTLLPSDSMADPAFGAEYSNTNYNIVFGNEGSNNLTVKRKKYLTQTKID